MFHAAKHATTAWPAARRYHEIQQGTHGLVDTMRAIHLVDEGAFFDGARLASLQSLA